MKRSLKILGAAAGFFGVMSAYSYDIKEGPFSCYITQCSSQGDDCTKAVQAAKVCTQRMQDKTKAQVEKEREENLRKHQAEVDAASKINQANQVVKDVGNGPSH